MDETIRQMTGDADGQLQYIKGVVESLLFVNEHPITMEQIKKVLEAVSNADIKKAITELQNEYDARRCGMMIIEIAGGYQMLSNPVYAPYLRNFYKTKHKEKLSKPALESMAIVAYKQPVTRSDIELIRGVNSDGVVAHLLEKELIKVVGRKDVPGRPYLYGTTKQFLEYFGLKSLDDLPTLEEFPSLQPADEGNDDTASYQDGNMQGVLVGAGINGTVGEAPDGGDEAGSEAELGTQYETQDPEGYDGALSEGTQQQDLDNETEKSAQ